jgi:hypothetical protein
MFHHMDCVMQALVKKKSHWKKDLYYSVKVELQLAAGEGNPAAVRVWARRSGQIGSRPGQKPELLSLGVVDTSTGHKAAVFRHGWNQTAVSYYGSYHFGSCLAPIMYLSSHCIVT